MTRTGAPVRATGQRPGAQKSRREQVEGSLKEIEQRRSKAPPRPFRCASRKRA
jgi:hypothetical protein